MQWRPRPGTTQRFDACETIDAMASKSKPEAQPHSCAEVAKTILGDDQSVRPASQLDSRAVGSSIVHVSKAPILSWNSRPPVTGIHTGE